MLATDGATFRLIDGLRGAGQGFVDVDLDECVRDAPSLAWLRRLAGPAAFVAGADTYLQRWLSGSDAHGRRVCRALRDGVGEALGAFTAAVAEARGRRGDLHACYSDALTAVYRTLFLLFAEARQLVPMWHPVYRRGYSIDALGHRLATSRPPRGTWATLQAIARLAHAGADGGDLRVTAFNGRLFAPARAPLLDHLALDDQRVASALDALCFTRAAPGGSRQRIAYAELGVEELGSVYESLLDLEPVAPSPRAVRLRPSASAARKTTGTFYTPRAVADVLVRDTLAPLVEGRSPEEILSLRVLDPAMGSGAFLVAVSRFLAIEWERALVDRGDAAEGDITDADRVRDAPADCQPMPVRRGSQPDGRATGAVVRVARDAGRRSAAVVSRSPPRAGQQPDRRLAARRSGPPASQRPPARTAAARRAVRVVERAGRLFARGARTSRRRSTTRPTSSAARRPRWPAFAGDPGLARWKAACDLWCVGWMPGGPDRRLYHALLDRALGRRGHDHGVTRRRA